MTFFTQLLQWNYARRGARSRSRPAKVSGRRTRLNLEGLEDRLAPASVFVVPLAVATDGAHFHTLTTALLAAGASGTVTIEPGTTPDTSPVNIGQPVFVQGDTNIPASILSRYDINVVANNVTLVNLNLGTVTMGGGVNTTIVSKNLIVNLTELAATSGNGNSTINLNTITGTVVLGGSTNGTAVNDVVARNTFNSLAPVMLTLTSSAGDTVRLNQFNGDLTGQVAIQVVDSGSASALTTITQNTINLFGVASTGMYAAQVGGATWTNVFNNTFFTNSAGFGFTMTMNNAAGFHANVQGNDFHSNLIGVRIQGDGGSTSLFVDLGVGAFNSLGANNFRSFTGTGTQSNAAILLVNTPAGANIPARQNLWNNNINPNNVIDDRTHGAMTGTGNIDTSSPLSQQRAFVQALYNELLGRSGSLGELDAWVNVLNTRGQASVANSILRSTESLQRIINAYYVKYLGRNGDSAGIAAWVNFLQNGGNLESMTTGFTTSPEYIGRINTDFVQSLYLNVLGRTASAAELANWNNQITTIGLVGIANGFSFSQEYRSDYVISFYIQFLHRVPSPSEVSAVVALQGDILSLQVFILSSPEYFTNG